MKAQRAFPGDRFAGPEFCLLFLLAFPAVLGFPGSAFLAQGAEPGMPGGKNGIIGLRQDARNPEDRFDTLKQPLQAGNIHDVAQFHGAPGSVVFLRKTMSYRGLPSHIYPK